MLENYTGIQLPEGLNQWFDQEVYVGYTGENTLVVRNRASHMMIEQNIRERARAQFPDRPGFSAFLLAGIAPCDIGKSGILYLPGNYYRHFCPNGQIKDVEVFDDRLILHGA